MKNEDELYSTNRKLNFMIFNAEKSQQQCNLGEEQNRERFSLTMTKSSCSEEDPALILLRRNILPSILLRRNLLRFYSDALNENRTQTYE
jgi:hypothetical protein